MSPEQKQLALALEGESKIELFMGKEVRKVMHNGEWWFVVVDVIETLLDVADGSDYLKKMRQRDEALKEGWGQIVTPLPFNTTKGIQQLNCINIEGIFRLMQSVSSKKAEPFKKWLAKVGFERVQELDNPELAIKRAIAIYHAKGYPPEWIDARIPNKIARERLEEQWHKSGINQAVEFAVLTNAISEETFGIDTAKHRKVKNLGKSHSLRDNMTPIELTLTTLAEQATRAIAESNHADNLYKHKIAAKSGGSIAGQARRRIQEATGKPVISPANYLTAKQRKNVDISGDVLKTIGEIKKMDKSPKPSKEK